MQTLEKKTKKKKRHNVAPICCQVFVFQIKKSPIFFFLSSVVFHIALSSPDPEDDQRQNDYINLRCLHWSLGTLCVNLLVFFF